MKECVLFCDKRWRTNQPYHICYEVDDLLATLQMFQDAWALVAVLGSRYGSGQPERGGYFFADTGFVELLKA